METIKVRKKHQITLPAAIREAAGVYEGDFLTVEVQEDRTRQSISRSPPAYPRQG